MAGVRELSRKPHPAFQIKSRLQDLRIPEGGLHERSEMRSPFRSEGASDLHQCFPFTGIQG